MQLMTLERLAGCLGQGFDVDLGTTSVALTLSEARPLPQQGFAATMRQPFSLVISQWIACCPAAENLSNDERDLRKLPAEARFNLESYRRATLDGDQTATRPIDVHR
jgi:hypothetical protein